MIAHSHFTDDDAYPDLLDLGSDLHLRKMWFVESSFSHPAKLHLGLLSWIVDRYTRPGETICDPMAGIGSTLYTASLGRNVIAREIELHWIAIMEQNAARIQERAGFFAGNIDTGQANACAPWDYKADHIIFSPPYGNEASTTGNVNRSLPYRLQSAHKLRGVAFSNRYARLLEKQTAGSMASFAFHYGTHPDQIGHYRGPRYYAAMAEIYSHAYEALGGGYMILILKDHINAGQRVQTAEATIELCESLGFVLYVRHQRRVFPLSLWQRRRKEQGLPVVEEEDVLVFRKARREVSA